MTGPPPMPRRFSLPLPTCISSVPPSSLLTPHPSAFQPGSCLLLHAAWCQQGERSECRRESPCSLCCIALPLSPIPKEQFPGVLLSPCSPELEHVQLLCWDGAWAVWLGHRTDSQGDSRRHIPGPSARFQVPAPKHGGARASQPNGWKKKKLFFLEAWAKRYISP